MHRPIALFALLALSAALPALGQDAKRPQNRPAQQPRFQFLFTFPGIEFSAEQQAKVDELREKYVPQLLELQRKRSDLFTAEQRRARQKAFRAARDASKSPQEANRAAEEAVKLTDEQREKAEAIQKEQAALGAQIRSEVRAVLTQRQRAQLRRAQQNANDGGPKIPPTHRDVKYGPHARNVMDVWLAKSDKPTPVLVSIHGGGFRKGNKSVSRAILQQCLDAGISVVAITYRLSDEAIAPAQFLDSARAIQFIRRRAKEWGLDPTRMAATGGSAGAGISLWLGFHDDLADTDNPDPVLRESTRLTCMAVFNGQTSYDPRFIRNLFPESNVYKEAALAQLFGVDLDKLDELPEEKYRLFEEVSALPYLTKDDPPVALFYASQLDTPITSQGIGIHHPRFGQALKEKMDALGIECELQAGVPRGDEWATKTVAFVKQHLIREQ